MGVKAHLKGIRKAAALLPPQKGTDCEAVDHYKNMKKLLMKHGPGAASDYFWNVKNDEKAMQELREGKERDMAERKKVNSMKAAALKAEIRHNTVEEVLMDEAPEVKKESWFTRLLSGTRSLLQWLFRRSTRRFGKV